ncbi:hypothetical protein VW29_09365 [Devosia limi DSM 17137]|uniref:Uncharacterized protein n=1 Tax=Devosia limi DSM 17137 TaxID=1121477 RepID=A0A0F5LRI4_9HYPH|nr:hypothetical protein VW29_09365 [Devosia limi DSM 17137]
MGGPELGNEMQRDEWEVTKRCNETGRDMRDDGREGGIELEAGGWKLGRGRAGLREEARASAAAMRRVGPVMFPWAGATVPFGWAAASGAGEGGRPRARTPCGCRASTYMWRP